MKKLILALLLFSSCSKDTDESLTDTPIVGEWNLVTVITQITEPDSVVTRDTTNYTTDYKFIFDGHGTYNIVYKEDGVEKTGAGTWYEETDGKVVVLNGFDSTQEYYVSNTLTGTNLELYSKKVNNDKAIEVWLNLKK